MEDIMLDARVCNATNTEVTDESNFFSENSINWDAHRIGWVIAGSMTILTIIISTYTVCQHTRHYHRPAEQRQIIRIILMPPVYAVISFFSYRFFRAFTYYHLVETVSETRLRTKKETRPTCSPIGFVVYHQTNKQVYEAFAISAFLFLLVQYIGNAPASQRTILANAPKRSVPFPFCFWRYRPSKPYFLHAIKWLVLQYCIFRPLITIVGIICEANNVLCATEYSIYFAQVYLEAIDFVVFSLALYGLVRLLAPRHMVFYTVTKVHLKGQSPLAKFLTIKGIVFFTFYQGFVFSILEKHGIIKGSLYWVSSFFSRRSCDSHPDVWLDCNQSISCHPIQTPTNVSEGLQALCTTIEMVVFSIIMIFSFSAKSYKAMKPGQTSPGWKSFFHSQNYSQLFLILSARIALLMLTESSLLSRRLPLPSIYFTMYAFSFRFFKDYVMRKPYTRSLPKNSKATGLDFEQAYAWADSHVPIDDSSNITHDKSYRLGLMHSKMGSIAESHRP
ncbi:uncharacterized protein VP01_2692g2 [Puccinia sorghi]|uniref:Transmembrane protein n=1 Tax=Puccinia sorghi TaxID=27349 RepID=A0A0L6V3W2_9BASI|nr:uncharacterized protein VP01_2692g2 [Puccinia sorghi]